MRLRTHLGVLAVAVLLPVLAFSVIAVFLVLRLERQAAEKQIAETAKRIALSVDRELAKAEAALRVLASSMTLTAGNFDAFRTQAEAAITSEGAWIRLLGPGGRQLVNTRAPREASLPLHTDPERLTETMRTQRTSVSDLYTGGFSRRLIVSVDLPVVRNGESKYVLSMALLPETLTRVLEDRPIPADWIVAIFDRKGLTIARNVGADRFIGQPGRPDLIAEVRETPEGAIRNVSREGIPLYNAFTRSELSDWSVVVGVPLSTINAPVHRAVWAVAVGAFAALVIGVGLAAFVGRRIATPVVGLTRSARELSRGAAPVRYGASVTEVAELGRALEDAARLIRERDEVQGYLAALVQSSKVAIVGRDRLERGRRAHVRIFALRDDRPPHLAHGASRPQPRDRAPAGAGATGRAGRAGNRLDHQERCVDRRVDHRRGSPDGRWHDHRGLGDRARHRRPQACRTRGQDRDGAGTSGPSRGGGGQPGEGRIPGHAVPRAADAAERDPRLGQDAPRRHARHDDGATGAGGDRAKHVQPEPAHHRSPRRQPHHHRHHDARDHRRGSRQHHRRGTRSRAPGGRRQEPRGHQGAHRRHRARRGRPAAFPADRLEPALQFREVHTEWGTDRREALAHREVCRARRARHRTRHQQGVFASPVRALSPGRQQHDAGARRPGPRTRHRTAPHRASRRDGDGGEPRRRRGIDVHGHASDRTPRPASARPDRSGTILRGAARGRGHARGRAGSDHRRRRGHLRDDEHRAEARRGESAGRDVGPGRATRASDDAAKRHRLRPRDGGRGRLRLHPRRESDLRRARLGDPSDCSDGLCEAGGSPALAGDSFQMHLPKPVEPTDLVDAVRKLARP